MKNNKLTIACKSSKFLKIRILPLRFYPTLMLFAVLHMLANVYGQASAMSERKLANPTTNTLQVNRPAEISTSSQALPVNYGPISAMVKDGVLTVSWMTTFETNNKEFVIEGSFDGLYWKKIGTVMSGAKNGNSDKPLKYSFDMVIDETAIAGFSPVVILVLSTIILMLLPSTRKRSFFASITFVSLLISLTLASCRKTEMPVEADKRLAKFIRIGQIDVDNITYYSKVIKMVTR